ncbi:MAG: ornithine carbamoyltransferase [Clostridia bacterium]|nr:ornithine carbamoyltransferase [Clostridia bacterium]
MKNLLSISHLTKEELSSLLNLTKKLKYENSIGRKHHLLKGKTLGMIFSKSSTRTRVSFETGMYQLGGHSLFLSADDIQLGRGESISDTAKVLSRYLDGIIIRTFSQDDVVELADSGNIPVINALTDLLHPCQVLADLFTVKETFHKLEGLKVAYIGDGNNIANSLLYGCSKSGVNLSVATPAGYECNPEIVKQAEETAKENHCQINISNHPQSAVKDADVIYTDTWTSMGMEEEKEKRIRDFDGFQVNSQLMSHAKSHAIFLHCLPAYRGYEVTEDVIDGPQSKVFDQAENRLHMQKAILVKLLGGK